MATPWTEYPGWGCLTHSLFVPRSDQAAIIEHLTQYLECDVLLFVRTLPPGAPVPTGENTLNLTTNPTLSGIVADSLTMPASVTFPVGTTPLFTRDAGNRAQLLLSGATLPSRVSAALVAGLRVTFHGGAALSIVNSGNLQQVLDASDLAAQTHVAANAGKTIQKVEFVAVNGGALPLSGSFGAFHLKANAVTR